MQTIHALFMPESTRVFLVPELYMSRYSGARFLKTAVGPADFGDDSGYEVAIAGRSNSGKSSALNAIVRRGDLARTSAMPGRTQAVNLFELRPGRRLVDLPGYGHSRAPPAVRATWARLMDSYFSHRRSLSGLLIVVDARRGFGRSDESMLAYAEARALPSHVLLSKSDKLGRTDSKAALETARRALGARAGVQLFSAQSGEGVEAAQGALEAMLAGQIKAPGDP
jgi:GTP-binding protein